MVMIKNLLINERDVKMNPALTKPGKSGVFLVRNAWGELRFSYFNWLNEKWGYACETKEEALMMKNASYESTWQNRGWANYDLE